jgi:MFS family permease
MVCVATRARSDEFAEATPDVPRAGQSMQTSRSSHGGSDWIGFTFRALRAFNYRLWVGGSVMAHIGAWMQRIAQDWLVFTQLTHRDAAAMGVVMALQFGPQVLLLPWTGLAADQFDRRRLLMATQAGLGVLTAALGTLTVLNLVKLWQVYVFALLAGSFAAFTNPASQVFVMELVGDGDVSNAIALNAVSINAARLIGPALAGVLIEVVGCGWAFLTNAVCSVAVLFSLSFLRVEELRSSGKELHARSRPVDGLLYVRRRADLIAVLVMVLVLGTFTVNFPIFVSTMTVMAFHRGAGEYGALSSIVAFGTLAGALWAASRRSSRFSHVLTGAAGFGVGCAIAAVSPGLIIFSGALMAIGISILIFNTSTNTVVQLSTVAEMRGQVMAIYVAVSVGGAPLGAPLIGWAADTLGPRYALGLGAVAGIAAACVGSWYLITNHELRAGPCREDPDVKLKRPPGGPKCIRGETG